VTAARDPFARYRERLRALGFRPSSARGQNFLLDPSLHRAIADAAAPCGRDLVLEVGVGLGFLTRELGARAGAVLGVEIDSRLLAVAAQELAALPNVRLLHADALGGPGRSLHPDLVRALAAALPRAGAFLVVANLPYSVSGPLLCELVGLDRPPDRMVVLVQRELGDRIAAPVGARQASGLAALVQSAYAVRRLRAVAPEVFRPRPKVASVLLQLERLEHAALPAGDERRRFARFVRAVFQQRRKLLRTTLPAAAAACGHRLEGDPEPDWGRRRAEELDLPALVALFRRVLASPPASAGTPAGGTPLRGSSPAP
jgi:16S rRNA (adenine1518-N6/adenine1519-N6)-dimethyltransferase